MAVTPVRSTSPASVPGGAGQQGKSTEAQGNNLLNKADRMGDGSALGKSVVSDQNDVLNTTKNVAKQTVDNAAATTELTTQVDRLLSLFRKIEEWTNKVYAR